MARRNGNESIVVIERGSRAVPLLAILSVVLAAVCALLGARIAQTSAQPSIDETVVTKQLKNELAAYSAFQCRVSGVDSVNGTKKNFK